MEQQADNYIEELKAIRQIEGVKRCYAAMSHLLSDVLLRLTAQEPIAFSGNLARLNFVCQKYALAPRATFNGLRLRCYKAHEMKEAELERNRQADENALAALCALLSPEASASTSKSSAGKVDTPSEGKPLSPKKRRIHRVVLTDTGDFPIVRGYEDETAQTIEIDLEDADYLEDMLTDGTQLNLIDSHVSPEGVWVPRIVIFEPDFLVDISSIAASYTSYAISPKVHLMNRLKPRQTSEPILLGEMASQLLDERLASLRAGMPEPPSYNSSAKRFFQNNAVALTTCQLSDEFHDNARRQKDNIAKMTDALRKSDKNFAPERMLTETSFVSEALGLQGRMDFVQDDYKVLIEQKSGKKDFKGGHKEEHYVQIVLYKEVLNVSFGVSNDTTSQYLLYSNYLPSQGLFLEGANPQRLCSEVFKLRNEIVFNELRYAQPGEIANDIEEMMPEDLHLRPVHPNFWACIERQFWDTFGVIQDAEPTAKAYFFRMMQFLQKENLLQRLGNSRKDNSGFAALWNTPASDRRLAGNLMDNMRLVGTAVDKERCYAIEGEVDILELERKPSDTEQDFMETVPNFRKGDAVVLYDYSQDEEPDIRKTMEIRANIIGITDKWVRLQMRSAQNEKYFTTKGEDRLWAIEHDLLDSHSSNLAKSLLTLLTANEERRTLLLGQRKPETDSKLRPQGQHAEMDSLVEKAVRAKDYFLIVGPPGTGKTSFGLMSLVREELLRPQSSLLLMAFTNRAVDEICSKLVKDGIDFLRIGSRFSCADEFKPYLLNNKEFSKLSDVCKCLVSQRVVVCTTASMMSSIGLLGIRQFDLAIIDEASQILEPNIIGLLSAKLKGDDGCDTSENSIRRFVLIGDEKQLPAVVSQSAEDSRTTEPELHKIGLTDCRASIFERLLRLNNGNEDIIFRLTKQGRMHPATADFCNKHFYGGQLKPIPLPHQKAELTLSAPEDCTPLMKALAGQRVLFCDSRAREGCQGNDASPLCEKVNKREAAAIARIVKTATDLLLLNGKPLDPAKAIGIVVPYRNQITAIRQQLLEGETDEARKDFWAELTIDTVERLQGSERDMIVYGFTVHNRRQLDFLTDSQYTDADGTLVDRKLNVALSRAREQLIVVGDTSVITTVPIYKALVESIGCQMSADDIVTS